MSYLVLARKYRPQTFDEVVGQNHVTTTLRNAIEQGRVHHAFLFSGVRGTGKTTTARILAKALNCEQGPTPSPCNECRSCREIAAGTSPDVLEIDGASHTGVDDIRELREAVRYLPTYGRQKVYIIDEVHMLSVSAFNALLKTLEEPPAHVTFIFATTEPQKIPATILSRCQRFDFRRVTVDEIQGHLSRVIEQEGLSAEDAAVRTIAVQAGGSVRDSLSLLDQIIAYSAGDTITEDLVARVLGLADRAVLARLAEALLARDPASVLEIIDEVFRSGWDLVQLLRALVSYLRDMVVLSVAKTPDRLLSIGPTELEAMKALASRHSPDRLIEVFDALVRTTEDVSRSEFQKLTCEMRLVELALTEPILPFAELLQRLEGLETRLGGSAPAVPNQSRRGTRGQGDHQAPEPNAGRRPQGRRPADGPGKTGSSPSGYPDGGFRPDPRGRSAAAPNGPGSPRQSGDRQATPPHLDRQTNADDAEAFPMPSQVTAESETAKPTPDEQEANAGQPSRPTVDDFPFPPPSEAEMDRWEQLVAAGQTSAPFLAATLSLSRLMSLEETAGKVTVRLGVAPSSLEETRLDATEAARFADFVREALGVEVSLELVEISPQDDAFIKRQWRDVVEVNRSPAGPAPEDAEFARIRPYCLADKKKLDKAKREAQIQREALEDPLIRKARDLFGAKVRTIKVLV